MNGHVIPYNMKIGDAGEAFFVFETDDDVPNDLLTSPILEPTRAEDEKAKAEPGRFGAKEDPEENQDVDDGQAPPLNQTSPEPEPFDLDATDGTAEARKPPPSLNLKGTHLPFPHPTGLLTPIATSSQTALVAARPQASSVEKVSRSPGSMVAPAPYPSPEYPSPTSAARVSSGRPPARTPSPSERGGRRPCRPASVARRACSGCDATIGPKMLRWAWASRW